mmetsp:Transcript_12788/g.21629  ORF Transcript_12788/g.21629 Transcript_12788/m.21629 type:complete len:226 (-) Transcript_12788:192-869(-)|eukprot:CAMPEP_0168607472 /NCGR_PEP_ID=MMETSP0449_2-20121227/63_1 /TAXON_ID=1082188 /ORGANISM="Strombidium rassoulzadegani, Strain ras09" /LENGTH=225 /DNA_ID=CAMNT_0008647295 /DNA_START=1115 /DNA_END=1792 /DNA_ORIENTATION=-
MRRPYTEAFSLRKDINQALVHLSKTAISIKTRGITEESMEEDKETQACLKSLRERLEAGNADSVCLSVKDYFNKRGLSNYLFEDAKKGMNCKYEIQGPMGRGLGIHKTGLHVAYAAGTGMLVFVDIVAHLILRILRTRCFTDLCEEEGESVRSAELDNFRFVLHTSFLSEEEALCMDLINSLTQLCQTFGYPKLFEHISRISNKGKKGQRWDQGYFMSTLQHLKE